MRSLFISLKIFLFLTILTGIVYPLIVTGVTQVIFPAKANGSMILVEDKPVGSTLIGQRFDSAIYFTSRPSAIFYNPLPSGGSNYGLTNTKLKDLVTARKNQFALFNQLDTINAVPSEMLFASASGLDPHISPESAYLQADRVARARNLSESEKQQLIRCIGNLTEGPQFSLLGQVRINVLLLNLEIDKLFRNSGNQCNFPMKRTLAR